MSTLQEYKCPCCGGTIGFDSATQKMKCPYCDTEFEVETLKKYDEDLKNDSGDSMEWQTDAGSEWKSGEADSLCSYTCNSCGGEIVSDETTAATACPFCGSPIIMKGRLSGMLRPDYVIPFKLDKKAAKAAYMRHITGKRLLPKVFRDQNHIDEIKGVYVPFWLFNAEADVNVRYRATAVRAWNDNENEYTETSYYAVQRGGSIGFDNIPVDGSTKMPDDLMESIEPFDFSEAVDFQTAYLAGYLADKYDVDAEQSVDRANQRVKRSAEEAFASTAAEYATLQPEASSVRIHNGKVKYALYPVWLLNTTWNGNRYTFAMNGQTGKLVGDLPVDKSAATKWRLALTFGCGAAIYGICWLLRLLRII